MHKRWFGLGIGLGIGALGFVGVVDSDWAKRRKLQVSLYSFGEYAIKCIEPLSPDTSRFTLNGILPSLNGSCNGPEHIIVKDDSCQIARPYTLLNIQADSFDIIVKRYPDGLVSRMLHDLRVGSKVHLRGPLPSISPSDWSRIQNANELTLIAGGTGLLPLYGLLKSSIKTRLIYANKSEVDILLRDELDQLQALQGNLDIIYTLESPPEHWTHSTGRVGAGMIKGSSDQLFVICGPQGMVHSLAGHEHLDGILTSIGIPRHQIIVLESS